MRFRGEYGFLSNFYNCCIEYEGKVYSSVENAFQASKTLSEDERVIFTKYTPIEAKRLGRKVKLRGDWEEVKVLIMTELIFIKFSVKELSNMLLSVKEDIVENNTWHDNFWGVCTCPRCNERGANVLGIILSKVRDNL